MLHSLCKDSRSLDVTGLHITAFTDNWPVSLVKAHKQALFCVTGHRALDSGAVTSSSLGQSQLLVIAGPVKNPDTGKLEQAKSSNAHMLPIVRELRRLGPAGIMQCGPGIDGEKMQCS